MAEAPALTIRRDWARPDPSMLAKFAGFATGNVVDAMGRSGALDFGIRPIIPAKPFIGAALPVNTTARDNLGPYAALKVAKPGDVMLISTGDYAFAAVIGDVMVGMMKNAGIVAVITDGLARDIPGLTEVGIPVFARGVTPNSPFKHGPATVGLPISIGGVIVGPGDVVLGDQDGIVVVPAARLAEVISELPAVHRKESDMEALVAKGSKEPPWLDAALQEKPVHWIE